MQLYTSIIVIRSCACRRFAYTLWCWVENAGPGQKRSLPNDLHICSSYIDPPESSWHSCFAMSNSLALYRFESHLKNVRQALPEAAVVLPYVFHAVNAVLEGAVNHGNACGNIDDIGIDSEVSAEGDTKNLDSETGAGRNQDSTAMSDIIAEEGNLPKDGTTAHNKMSHHLIDWANTM